MSRDDFERCTPQEFYKTWTHWNELREAELQGEWERLRYMGLFMLQPYSKKRLKVTDVMQFPWEGEENEKRRMKNEKSRTLDAEGERERYEAAKKRYGIE